MSNCFTRLMFRARWSQIGESMPLFPIQERVIEVDKVWMTVLGLVLTGTQAVLFDKYSGFEVLRSS
jgi:hypothetical protein